MPRTLFVFGTRPEAIKLCPLILHMCSRAADFEVQTAVTGQHRDMLDPILEAFSVRPDYDLDLMQPGQTLAGATSRMLAGLEPVLTEARPDIVFVQGDTMSTLAGALCAFYAHIPVAHVEAGLRTGDAREPFPEEMNRVLTSRLATLHFAATSAAEANLLAEGVTAEAIAVTGNSGIDAVNFVRDRLAAGLLEGCRLGFLDESRKLIVVTAHRRESFGDGLANICRAVRKLAAREDVQIVWPVHRNPHVSGPVHATLSGVPSIHLTEPLSYVPFVDLMRRATVLVTDSGGIQEEALSLGKPAVVMRARTERPEGVEAGAARLAGTDETRIVSEVSSLLDHPEAMAAAAGMQNPYGDGQASGRIADAALRWFRKTKAMKSKDAHETVNV
ncbi:MAG TPA: UDP-N-acetylglucosamine 2-epimerase (non-hydrolyzing) [Bryobacteraceae bacterium]|nr:UDP-N-acetylglucosamine 2-epimerase (non-hydrolyzing) [Bryobacteraceae bacterium]